MHLCRVMCRILPLCADLRRTVQHFAVIVPFHAVWCRAENASRCVPEPRFPRRLGVFRRLLALRLRHLPRFPRRQPRSRNASHNKPAAEVIYWRKQCTCAALCAAFCPALCSTLPSSCRSMPSCAAPGVCWRCDCVTCLGSLGASQKTLLVVRIKTPTEKARGC